METEDLKLKLEELRKEMIKNRSQVASGTSPKNPGQIKQTRKIIARLLTVINKKENKKA
ncbi:MAG: 50S ribosomal protein L29 [bacterium]|nr:50S ribosomal protein L29 [bacterium]